MTFAGASHPDGPQRRASRTSVDVFHDPTAYSGEQVRRILDAARDAWPRRPDPRRPARRRWGSGARGGARLPVGRPSRPHLTGRDGRALGASDTIGVLIPGSLFFVPGEKAAPVREMIEAGVAIGLSTDYTPGTSPVVAMPVALTLCDGVAAGCRPRRSWRQPRSTARFALGLRPDEVGSLEPGKLRRSRDLRSEGLPRDPVPRRREPRSPRDRRRTGPLWSGRRSDRCRPLLHQLQPLGRDPDAGPPPHRTPAGRPRSRRRTPPRRRSSPRSPQRARPQPALGERRAGARSATPRGRRTPGPGPRAPAGSASIALERPTAPAGGAGAGRHDEPRATTGAPRRRRSGAGSAPTGGAVADEDLVERQQALPVVGARLDHRRARRTLAAAAAPAREQVGRLRQVWRTSTPSERSGPG